MSDQQCIELENKIKSKVEQLNLYEKELTQFDMKNETFRKEIAKKQIEITNYQKQFGSNAPVSSESYKNVTKATALITLEEQILKEFSSIQQRCNLNLQEKYKFANIERLVVQQMELNISYLIIKRLDIKEEFYLNNKITEVPNLFENLNAISKMGKLNYDSLRTCGPYLVFRLTSDSKFSDLKHKACAVWSLPDSSYSLYDDMFISMECANESNVQSYFSFYQPADSTLPAGHACFYLMEKLKSQKSLLEMQNRTLDKADSGSGDSNNNKGSHLGSDLETCISKMEKGEILKGINSYKRMPTSPVKVYKRKVLLIDNNIVFIILILVIIALSIYANNQKKSNMLNWSNNGQVIFNLFNSLTQNTYNSDNIKTLQPKIDYVKDFIDALKSKEEIGLMLFGMIQFRFFKTNTITDCFLNKNLTINALYLAQSGIKCFYSDYVGDKKIDKLSSIQIGGNSYSFKEQFNTLHSIDNGYGKIGKGGNELSIKAVDWGTEKTRLNNLIEEQSIQGFECQIVVYNRNLDLFTSVLILVQKDLDNAYQVSELHAIPFMTNVYENNASLKAIDLAKLLIMIVMLSCLVLTIIQKSLRDKESSPLKRVAVVITTLFSIKFLLLIFSFAFMAASFAKFSQLNLNSNTTNTDGTLIDFYYYANSQKEARNLDLIALYLLFIFLLKYLQFLPYIDLFYKSLKKASFELFILFFTILIVMLSLSYLTFYVYGTHLEEYSTFSSSLIFNIKILLFIESSDLRQRTVALYRDYAVIIFLVYVVLIRYFLLFLTYPICIEYLRIQLEKMRTNQIVTTQNMALSAKEKLKLFLTSCKFFGKVLKGGEVDTSEKKESRKATEQLHLKAVDALLERTVE